jgi:hypothetical protein
MFLILNTESESRGRGVRRMYNKRKKDVKVNLLYIQLAIKGVRAANPSQLF